MKDFCSELLETFVGLSCFHDVWEKSLRKDSFVFIFVVAVAFLSLSIQGQFVTPFLCFLWLQSLFIKFVLTYNVARFNRRILARFGESPGANIVQKHWLRSKYLSILNFVVFLTLTLFQFMNDYSFTSRDALLN